MDIKELEKARLTAERLLDEILSKPGSGWCHPSHHVRDVLEQVGAEHQLEHLGVEGTLDDQVDIQYLFTGDTYEMTLCYDGMNQQFVVCSWGDLLEAQEQAVQ